MLCFVIFSPVLYGAMLRRVRSLANCFLNYRDPPMHIVHTGALLYVGEGGGGVGDAASSE
jgi:hypothetical protein